MVNFSDSYTNLDKCEHIELIAYIDSYAHLFYGSKYDIVRLPTGNIGIRARVSLQAGSDSPLIQHEPIVIEICGEDIEESIINVYPDRTNFPFDNFPHINFAVGELPPSLCLTREDFVNWYAEHSFGDLLELIQQWFDDALKDNLIKTDTGDFYEPFRIENADSVMFKIPVEDSFLETYDFPGCICYKVDSHGMNLYTRECGIKSDKQDIGVLLFRSCKLVCKKWFVEQPKTLGALLSFASTHDFVIDTTKIEESISSHGSCPENIFFQFAFVRPVRVLGKESKIDYLTFCTKMEDYLSENTNATVHNVQMIDFATPKLANYISDTPDDVANKNLLILGCGAIGSKLIYHLYRSGICNLTICDKDCFLPHNVCRHALTKPRLIDSKVKLVKKELDSMYLMNSDKVKIVEQDILQWLPSTDLSKYDLLIDATASASVFRLLDKITQNTSIPVVHFALSDAGNIGHVYINTKHDALLSDYYMYLAQESVNNDDVSEWLKRESKYNLDLIRIGEGCHSKTMRLGDDVISTHTGIAASIIKSALAVDLNNTIYLSYVNIEYIGQVFTEKYSVPHFLSCKCSNNDEWQIRIPDSLLKKIQCEAKIAGKKEVGGYLMGNIDMKHKTVYVLHQFKPDDSKQNSSKLKLGTKGWREEYLKVKERSAGMLDYIGDWHSHPSGCLEMSTTDILTNYAIKTEEIPSDYGLCIITNSSNTAAYLLMPGIEVYVVEE